MIEYRVRSTQFETERNLNIQIYIQYNMKYYNPKHQKAFPKKNSNNILQTKFSKNIPDEPSLAMIASPSGSILKLHKHIAHNLAIFHDLTCIDIAITPVTAPNLTKLFLFASREER